MITICEPLTEEEWAIEVWAREEEERTIEAEENA
jgi:hypothetical protein